MAKTITSFNGGLFSSYLKGRIELDKYSSALQDVENYHLLKYGGLQNRAGTFICEQENYDDDIRLITFQYNIKQSYVLSFCNNELKILKDGSFLPLTTISSPYDSTQVHQIQFVQVADIMYFTHPDVSVRKLTRLAEDNWEFKEVENLKKYPFLDYNKSDTELTPSDVSGTITVTSSTPIFESYHVGRTIEFKQMRTNNSTTTADVWLACNGSWNLSTQGSWNGNLLLQRTVDDGVNIQDYRTYGSSYVADKVGGTNHNIDGKEESPNAQLRLHNIPSGCTATLTINDLYSHGVVEITSITDASTAECTVISALDNTTPTKDWAFNAFSDETGYPTGIVIYKNRLVLGGTYALPSTLFFSAIDEWENFETKIGALSSIKVKMNTSETIMWLNKERDSLTIGDSGKESSLSRRNESEGFSGDNLEIKAEGADGSSSIQSLSVNDANVFVSRDNKTIRVINYDFGSDKLQSKNLCSLSGTEFLDSGIKDFVFKKTPNTEMYFVLNNGKIAVMTYDSEENIFGWSIFTTNGKIQSACVLKKQDSDVLYLAVERELSGVKKLFIEEMAVREFDTKEDWHFLDCGYFNRYTVPTKTITGLDLFNGETLTVVANGNILGEFEVVANKIELPYEVTTASVGFPYSSYVQVMDIDTYANGQSNIPQRKKHNKLYVKVRKTVGMFAGDSRDNLEKVNIHNTSDVFLSNIKPITDTITININTRHKEEYAPYFAQLIPQAQEILGYASSVSVGI